MFSKKIVLLLIVLSRGFNLAAIDLPTKTLYEEARDTGDHYFQKEEYYKAFHHYRHATKFKGDVPDVHYRLGRLYGLLEPEQTACEKEYAIAMSLVLKNQVDMEQINLVNFREMLGIPIDPMSSQNESLQNPILFMKRDVDQDGAQELFVLMQRGLRSYAFFVAEYWDHVPKITHLLSFYEGDHGSSDIQFKDLNNDGIYEVIIRVEMKDFLNLYVFAKDYSGVYKEIVSEHGLLQGTYLFADVKGDEVRELEVREKLREESVFNHQEGPYITGKKILMWNGEKYEPIHVEIIKNDPIYVLNEFFVSLIQKENYDQALRYIEPGLFVGRLDRDVTAEELKKYLQHPDYAKFLASNPEAAKLYGHMRLREVVHTDHGQGWEEGTVESRPSPVLQNEHLEYKLLIGTESYTIKMVYKDNWKVESLIKDQYQFDGWAVQP